MRIDEAQHSQEALESGAEDLPEGIKKLMSVIVRVMHKSRLHLVKKIISNYLLIIKYTKV